MRLLWFVVDQKRKARRAGNMKEEDPNTMGDPSLLESARQNVGTALKPVNSKKNVRRK